MKLRVIKAYLSILLVYKYFIYLKLPVMVVFVALLKALLLTLLHSFCQVGDIVAVRKSRYLGLEIMREVDVNSFPHLAARNNSLNDMS